MSKIFICIIKIGFFLLIKVKSWKILQHYNDLARLKSFISLAKGSIGKPRLYKLQRVTFYKVYFYTDLLTYYVWTADVIRCKIN